MKQQYNKTRVENVNYDNCFASQKKDNALLFSCREKRRVHSQDRGKKQCRGDARPGPNSRDTEQQLRGQRTALYVEPGRIPHRYVYITTYVQLNNQHIFYHYIMREKNEKKKRTERKRKLFDGSL